MEKILVTGGTGFIGSHTVVELLNAGYNVDIIDNLYNSKATVVIFIEKITGKRPILYKLDMLDKKALTELFDHNHYDSVLHFAGLKAVAESVKKPLLYYHINIDISINLIEVMLSHNINNIIFSSSATVYGQQDSPELTENMKTGYGISSPYGKSKYMIEEILKDTCVSHPSFSATILRYFNPIGNHPSGFIGENPNGCPNNIMPVIMHVAQGKIPNLKIFGNDYGTPDGTCRRDYIHVADLAKGHLAALKNIQSGVKIYNLGTGTPISVIELLHAFESAAGHSIPHHIAPRRQGDIAEYWANPSLANRELNWKAHLTIQDAMNDTLRRLANIKS